MQQRGLLITYTNDDLKQPPLHNACEEQTRAEAVNTADPYKQDCIPSIRRRCYTTTQTLKQNNRKDTIRRRVRSPSLLTLKRTPSCTQLDEVFHDLWILSWQQRFWKTSLRVAEDIKDARLHRHNRLHIGGLVEKTGTWLRAELATAAAQD
jgi:hypothetical protein